MLKTGVVKKHKFQSIFDSIWAGVQLKGAPFKVSDQPLHLCSRISLKMGALWIAKDQLFRQAETKTLIRLCGCTD